MRVSRWRWRPEHLLAYPEGARVSLFGRPRSPASFQKADVRRGWRSVAQKRQQPAVCKDGLRPLTIRAFLPPLRGRHTSAPSPSALSSGRRVMQSRCRGFEPDQRAHQGHGFNGGLSRVGGVGRSFGQFGKQGLDRRCAVHAV